MSMESDRIPRQTGALASALCLLLLLSAAPARAGFVGSYAPENFTLTNSLADGFITPSPDGAQITVTGGNDGSGMFGFTELTIVAVAAGIVTWTYQWASLDLPGMDYAAYRLGGVYVTFADTGGQSGVIAFPVLAGQVFGWRVTTFDNLAEPGELILSDFSAPDVNVPEPGGMFLSATGIAGLLVYVLRKRR